MNMNKKTLMKVILERHFKTMWWKEGGRSIDERTKKSEIQLWKYEHK